jgi:hypothetical protein
MYRVLQALHRGHPSGTPFFARRRCPEQMDGGEGPGEVVQARQRPCVVRYVLDGVVKIASLYDYQRQTLGGAWDHPQDCICGVDVVFDIDSPWAPARYARDKTSAEGWRRQRRCARDPSQGDCSGSAFKAPSFDALSIKFVTRFTLEVQESLEVQRLNQARGLCDPADGSNRHPRTGA